MNIVLKGDPIGEFEFDLDDNQYGQKIKQCSEHDRGFIDTHIRGFLMLMLSILTAPTQDLKSRKKKIMLGWLEELKDSLGIILIKDRPAGQFRWKLTDGYARKIDEVTKVGDMENIKDFIDIFLLLIFETLIVEDNKEKNRKKNNIHYCALLVADMLNRKIRPG